MQDLIDLFVKQLDPLIKLIVIVGVAVFAYSLLRGSSAFRFFKAVVFVFFLLIGLALLFFQGYRDSAIGNPGLIRNLLFMTALGVPLWISLLLEKENLRWRILAEPERPSFLSLIWFVAVSFYVDIYFVIFTSARL